jgi:hypothetical protein
MTRSDLYRASKPKMIVRLIERNYLQFGGAKTSGDARIKVGNESDVICEVRWEERKKCEIKNTFRETREWAAGGLWERQDCSL